MGGFIPLGIKLVCFVYILNAVLFVFSMLVFYSRVMILGNEINSAVELLVRILLVTYPLYLYFRLGQLKKDAFFLAIIFHVFFLINNISAYLEYRGFSYTIIHITGLYGSEIYTPAQAVAFGLSTLVNTLILWYLYKKRGYFLLPLG